MFQNIIRNVISNQLVKIVFFLSFPEFNESLFEGVVEVECKNPKSMKIEVENPFELESFPFDDVTDEQCPIEKTKRIPRDCSIQFKVSPKSILRGQIFTLIVVVFWSFVGYVGLGFYPKILNVLVDDVDLYKELSGEWILDYIQDTENNLINHFVDYRDKKKLRR